MTQRGVFSVTLGDMSFCDLAVLTWKRALMCYQYAAYDPVDLHAEMISVGQLRGAIIDPKAVFNDVRQTDGWPRLPDVANTEESLTGLRASTSVVLADQWDRAPFTVKFRVLNSEGHATVALQFDTAFLPSAVGGQILMGMESLLVRAAYHPVQLGEVGDITGIVPAVRDEGWVQVDGAGWVRLAEVTRLVAAAPSVARCAVFIETKTATAAAGRLVAYLVPSRSGTSPEQVHSEVCPMVVSGRADVVAPQHYVLCSAAPADHDHAAWRSQKVLTSGSGRV